MELVTFTIGFTKTNASHFFSRLTDAGVVLVVDVRLNNTSQLSGFAKAEDLPYFLKQIAGIKYAHRPELAPTDIMLKEFKKEKGDWSVYERKFMKLMESRKIEDKFRPEMFDKSCLLCSEDKPHYCHRRLVVEYLNGKWGSALNVQHL